MVTWAFWLYASTVKQKNAVGGFTAHVAIAAWAFLYTEICNSVYTNKLQSKNNLQILHFLLTKKLLAEIIKKHWLNDAGKPDRFVRASEL